MKIIKGFTRPQLDIIAKILFAKPLDKLKGYSRRVFNSLIYGENPKFKAKEGQKLYELSKARFDAFMAFFDIGVFDSQVPEKKQSKKRGRPRKEKAKN